MGMASIGVQILVIVGVGCLVLIALHNENAIVCGKGMSNAIIALQQDCDF